MRKVELSAVTVNSGQFEESYFFSADPPPPPPPHTHRHRNLQVLFKWYCLDKILGMNNKFGDCKPILGTLIQKRYVGISLRGEGIYSKKYSIVIKLFQLSNYSINEVLGAVWF